MWNEALKTCQNRTGKTGRAPLEGGCFTFSMSNAEKSLCFRFPEGLRLRSAGEVVRQKFKWGSGFFFHVFNKEPKVGTGNAEEPVSHDQQPMAVFQSSPLLPTSYASCSTISFFSRAVEAEAGDQTTHTEPPHTHTHQSPAPPTICACPTADESTTTRA